MDHALSGPNGKALQYQGQTSTLLGWGPSFTKGDNSYQRPHTGQVRLQLVRTLQNRLPYKWDLPPRDLGQTKTPPPMEHRAPTKILPIVDDYKLCYCSAFLFFMLLK